VKLSFKIWNEFACFGARGGILPAHFFDPLRHSVGSPVKYHHVSPQHPKRWVAEFDFRTIIASPQALTISTAQCLLFSALRESPLRPWWQVSKGDWEEVSHWRICLYKCGQSAIS
jgi:hypothetical protein